MSFASVFVPNFMVQAIVRTEPELRERGVALVDGNPPLWKIIAANGFAMKAGIQVGMGGSQAKQFGSVEIRQRSASQERVAHAALLDVGWSVSPRIEDTAPDTMVIDIAGMASLFKFVRHIATTLSERVSSIGLSAQIAVASNIEAAIHASRGFAGITLIPPGEEWECLSSLPIEVFLPRAEILETLHRWGIRTCGALAKLPTLQLSERLGQEGVHLQALARGTHGRALLLAEPDICFVEEMSLDYSVTDLEPLSFLLGRLLDQLCARLEARSLAACAFHLQFGLKDPLEEDAHVKHKTSLSTIDAGNYEKNLLLPVPMRDSKILLKLLRLQLQSDPPRGSIIKIVMTAEPARPRAGQKGLFIPDSPDPEKLEVTIARLAGLVGNSNVGSPQLLDTHRPGGFQMAPFFPAAEESSLEKFSPSKAELRDSKIPEAGFHRTVIAFRMFRPEPQATVELREGCPWRICFYGLYAAVATASGPWRSSGNWWEDHGWRQDEWDIEILFDSSHAAKAHRNAQNGLYRIYYDWMRRGWFVRGRYD